MWQRYCPPSLHPAEDWCKDLVMSPYLSAQEMSSVWFIIGTISTQSDITGVMAEVMGTRWWRDGDESLLSLFTLHLTSMWFSGGPLLRYVPISQGFVLPFCRQWNVLYCLWFPGCCLNQYAFTSTYTTFIAGMIDCTRIICTFYTIDWFSFMSLCSDLSKLACGGFCRPLTSN